MYYRIVGYQENCNQKYEEEQNSVHLETFSQDEKVDFRTLIDFATHMYLLHKLSGLAKEEEIDVQLKLLPWDRLTGTPCDTLFSCLKH